MMTNAEKRELESLRAEIEHLRQMPAQLKFWEAFGEHLSTMAANSNPKSWPREFHQAFKAAAAQYPVAGERIFHEALKNE